DGALPRHRGGGGRVPRHPHHLHLRERPRPAALRVRGGDHRGARLALGHAGGRRGARCRADRRGQALARLGHPDRAPGLPGGAAPPAPGPLLEGAESGLSPPAPSGTVRVERTTRAGRAGLVGAALGLVALVSLPAWGDASTMRILVEFIALLGLAQMWNLLAGYAGLVLADDLGVDPFVAVPLAGLVTAALALPTAALVFRFRGGYFAVG